MLWLMKEMAILICNFYLSKLWLQRGMAINFDLQLLSQAAVTYEWDGNFDL